MGVVKWIFVAVLGLAGVGAIGFGFMAAGPAEAAVELPAKARAVALRPLPQIKGELNAPAKEPDKAPEKAPENAPEKTPEKVPEKTPEKPPEPKPDAGAAAPTPAPTPAPVAPKPPPAPVGDGLINLRASDTADVYVDGKKVGSSPLQGFKVRAGNHRIRFDCYDAAGNTVAGPVKNVTVKADEEQDVDFTCPEAQ